MNCWKERITSLTSFLRQRPPMTFTMCLDIVNEQRVFFSSPWTSIQTNFRATWSSSHFNSLDYTQQKERDMLTSKKIKDSTNYASLLNPQDQELSQIFFLDFRNQINYEKKSRGCCIFSINIYIFNHQLLHLGLLIKRCVHVCVCISLTLSVRW